MTFSLVKVIVMQTKNNYILNEENRAVLYSKCLECGIDAEAFVEAINKLYSLYTDEILVWLGGLYDGSIGGFYYSNAARDSGDCLPDIESTYQAIVLLRHLGVISTYDDIPEFMRKRIAGFICSLEDPRSGYFYHPQWSRELIDSKPSRKGRDLAWSIALSNWLNFELPYPSATNRLRGNSDKGRDKDEIFASKENFVSYINSLDWENDAVSAIHRIISLSDLIHAAGFSEVAEKYFAKIQNRESGFWAKDVNLITAQNAMGISLLYTSCFAQKIPNSENLINNLFRVLEKDLDADEVFTIIDVRNIWGAIRGVIKNLEVFGDSYDAEVIRAVRERLVLILPKAVEKTADCIAKFRTSTGAFTYFVGCSPITSQGVPVVSEDCFDGDVNATVLACGMIRDIYQVVGLSQVKVSPLDSSSFYKFLNSIK